jgi:hypothetical protein
MDFVAVGAREPDADAHPHGHTVSQSDGIVPGHTAANSAHWRWNDHAHAAAFGSIAHAAFRYAGHRRGGRHRANRVLHTALASGISTVEPSATLDINAINATVTAVSVGNITVTPGTPGAGPTPDATQRGIGAQGSGGAQAGVDVFAICNDRSLGPGAPTTLRAGATIDVFWAWFARTEEQIQQHIANANYEVRVDGVLLENWREFQADVRPAANNQFVVYWYVPYGPVGAGEHEITYQVTWSQPISDGFDEFGPDTENPFEQGNCNFTVRE